MKYNKEDINLVRFQLENCESVTVPSVCFKYLSIVTVNDICDIEAHIMDNGSVEGSLFDTKSPLQRLDYYPDVTHVIIELNNNEKFGFRPIWSDADYNGENNEYQKTKLINYKELKLSISKNNKKLSIYEVLKLEDGTIVTDEKGNEYVVEEDDECKYLFDTYVTDKILNSKFTIK